MTRIERFDPLFYGKDTTIGGSAGLLPRMAHSIGGYHRATAKFDLSDRIP